MKIYFSLSVAGPLLSLKNTPEYCQLQATLVCSTYHDAPPRSHSQISGQDLARRWLQTFPLAVTRNACLPIKARRVKRFHHSETFHLMRIMLFAMIWDGFCPDDEMWRYALHNFIPSCHSFSRLLLKQRLKLFVIEILMGIQKQRLRKKYWQFFYTLVGRQFFRSFFNLEHNNYFWAHVYFVVFKLKLYIFFSWIKFLACQKKKDSEYVIILGFLFLQVFLSAFRCDYIGRARACLNMGAFDLKISV